MGTTLSPAAAVDAMPLRHAGTLAISCPIAGLSAAEASTLCAHAAEAARRGAPFPVALAPPSGDALSLVVGGTVSDGRLTLAARLLRPGQPEAAALGAPRSPPVAIEDEAAVRAAIDAALARVLPWQARHASQLTSAPRGK